MSPPCPGCSFVFVLREDEGPCLKCVKLEIHKRGSPEYAELKTWPQCVMCGLTFRNMYPSPTGTCASRDCMEHAASGASSESQVDEQYTPCHTNPSTFAIGEAGASRVTAVHDRLKLSTPLQSAGSSSSSSAFPPTGTSHTTESLQRHEHGGGIPGDIKIFIAWQVRVSDKPGQVNAKLGGQLKLWAGSVFMTDIKAEIVTVINIEWVKDHSIPLLLEEVNFRWGGNRSIDPGTATLTLKDFYDHYNRPSEANAAINSLNVPTAWKMARKAKPNIGHLYFEMFIEYSLWYERTNSDALMDVEDRTSAQLLQSSMNSVLRHKRQQNDSLATSANQCTAKHAKATSTTVFSSEFRPSSRRALSAVHQGSQITFKKLIFNTHKLDGSSVLLATDIKFSGLLSNKPFGQGNMKLAFDLFCTKGSNQRLVAKRFFRLSDNSTETPESAIYNVADHRDHILDEAQCLSEAAWFLKEFYRYCERVSPKTSLDHDIQLAEAFLAEEVKENNPSPASGVVDYLDGEAHGFTWLVEQKRPKTVTKFSGTLNHSGMQRDLQSLTIYAFAHFVYLMSKGTRVLADIQGTSSNVNKKDTMILFDVMTHTTDGDSGIGDFGERGIESFVQDHKCGTVCKALGLDKKTIDLTEAMSDEQKGKDSEGDEQDELYDEE